ncbi:MAG TPA: DUF488 domain-containing protein [Rhodoferax sp.]|nr:DUF488 domain-containing protein [Rhodoferax sp.]
MSAKIPARHILIKRAYEPPADADGKRILVDRLWPRGIKKEALALSQWMKELSPSTELRHWYGHEPELWPEFRRRYAAELRPHAQEFESLRALAREGTITLVYSARNETQNNAVALREFLLAPGAIGAGV